MRTPRHSKTKRRKRKNSKVMNRRFVQAKSTYYKTMAHSRAAWNSAYPSCRFLSSGLGIFHHARCGQLCRSGRVHLICHDLHHPGQKLVNFVEQFMQGSAGFSRFLELMRLEPEIQDAPTPSIWTRSKGVPLRSYFFSVQQSGAGATGYPSLTIPAGEKFAFVGPSGGGKTTLCQLIPRFYDVTEGAVLIDGHDVRKITQHSLRQTSELSSRRFSCLQTVSWKISGTAVPMPQMRRQPGLPAKQEIHEDILAMPNGYETYVGRTRGHALRRAKTADQYCPGVSQKTHPLSF